MKSLRGGRDRRIFVVVPAVVVATFLSFQAVAFACAAGGGSSSTNVSSSTLEPGDSFVVGGSNLPTANVAYRLKVGTSNAGCRSSAVVLGAAVNSDVNRNIAPVTRTLPTNMTSGVRYLCWSRVGNDAEGATATPITVL